MTVLGIIIVHVVILVGCWVISKFIKLSNLGWAGYYLLTLPVGTNVLYGTHPYFLVGTTVLGIGLLVCAIQRLTIAGGD
jgi:hypothetical protein